MSSAEVKDGLGQDGDASRLRILKAAAEIAAECGYEGTTISRVTKRSGLPASSLYWFFRDKDHLLAEVIRHSFEQWIARQPSWDADRDADVEVGDGLRRILARSVRSLAEAPDFLRIGHMLLLESREVEPEARGFFLQVRADVEDSMAAWFASELGRPLVKRAPELPRNLARIVLASTDGMFLAYQIHDAWDPDDFVEVVVAIAERAVESARRPRRPGGRPR